MSPDSAYTPNRSLQNLPILIPNNPSVPICYPVLGQMEYCQAYRGRATIHDREVTLAREVTTFTIQSLPATLTGLVLARRIRYPARKNHSPESGRMVDTPAQFCEVVGRFLDHQLAPWPLDYYGFDYWG